MKSTHLFDRLIVRAELWLLRLDAERDQVAQLVERDGHQPHLEKWLDDLDIERTHHVDLVRKLESLRRGQYPALLLKQRPSGMLKATIPTAVRKHA